MARYIIKGTIAAEDLIEAPDPEAARSKALQQIHLRWDADPDRITIESVEIATPGTCVACGRTQAEFDENNRGLAPDDFDYLVWADSTRTLCQSCEDYPDGS